MLFKKDRGIAARAGTPQTGGAARQPFAALDSYVPLSTPRTRLYEALREAVPIIDAAVFKLIRLTGGFHAECDGEAANRALDGFVRNVKVGAGGIGLESFISTYFEQLLTCGTAVGEMVADKNGIRALVNVPLSDVELRRAPDSIGAEICSLSGGTPVPVRYPELVFFSSLNPEPGELCGKSLLSGLPFVSSVLIKIFNTIGVNWERVGNVRFAVTCKPPADASERAFAKERAALIAREWGEAMRADAGVRDFVAVGDVSVKAIGAESQIPDSEVPVRQLMEQIVAKTGLPPFMLGLSWSSTERMSSQQADALTSELEAYRRLLTPVIEKICRMFLRLSGFSCEPTIFWDDITLQDMVEVGRARLYNAQAAQYEAKGETR